MFKKYLIITLLVVSSLLLALVGVYYNSYRVTSVPEEISGQFRVARTIAGDSLRFLVIGDTGTGGDMQYAVAKALEKRCKEQKPDGLILLGDNFYNSGVESVTDEQWIHKMTKPYGSPCLKQLTIYPVLGNHDYRQNPWAQVDYSQTNDRWVMPNRFYQVDFDNLLRLVAFDSNLANSDIDSDSSAIDFLAESLETSTATWSVVTAHHPLSTSSTRSRSHSGLTLGKLLRPLVCGNTDLWLSGHAHHLEYRENDWCEGTGLVVSGSGGAKLYEVNQGEPGVKFVKSVYGYVELEVTRQELKIVYYDLYGTVLFSKSKEKSIK